MTHRHPGRPKRTTPWPTCKVEECERTTEGGSLGFCPTHYAAVRRGEFDQGTGQRLREAKRVPSYGPGARCVVEGCGRRPKGDGLCATHWLRRSKGQELGVPIRQRSPRVGVATTCIVVGCPRRPTSRGMCGAHAAQRKRGILAPDGTKLRDPLPGGRPRRERWVTRDGYTLIHAPFGHPHARVDGSLLEHRHAMEQFLGRYLEDWEIVHHKNGLRGDNRLENLELMDGRAGLGVGHPPGFSYTEAQVLQSLEHLKVNDPTAFHRVLTRYSEDG